MDVRLGLWRKLSVDELMLLNCGVGEDSWESLGLQGDPNSPFWRRLVLGVLWKDWCSFQTPVLWPPHVKSWLIGKDWCWDGLGAGEGDERVWDGWMASPTWWTWVWVNSGNEWWTERPGMLWFMGLQRVGHNWVTELTDWLTLGIYFWAHKSGRVNAVFFSSFSECLLHAHGEKNEQLQIWKEAKPQWSQDLEVKFAMTIHHGLKLAIEECNRCSKRILYSVITGDVSDRKLPDRGFFCLFVCFLRKGFSG